MIRLVKDSGLATRSCELGKIHGLQMAISTSQHCSVYVGAELRLDNLDCGQSSARKAPASQLFAQPVTGQIHTTQAVIGQGTGSTKNKC